MLVADLWIARGTGPWTYQYHKLFNGMTFSLNLCTFKLRGRINLDGLRKAMVVWFLNFVKLKVKFTQIARIAKIWLKLTME